MSDDVQLCEVLAILDVGHGNSAVLFSGSDVAVFDAGAGSGLLEFLSEHNVTRVKTVFLSHADQDHIGGLVGLLAANTVDIGRVVVNTDSLKGSAMWDDLLHVLSSAHLAGNLQFESKMSTGDSEVLGRVTAFVAGPTPYLSARGPGSTDRSGRRITSNSISAVIRLSTDEGPVAVLPGDLDSVGLSDLMQSAGALDAPILVFPHHGGSAGTANISQFVSTLVGLVRPTVVVFSIGRARQGTPDPAVVRSVRHCVPNVRIICTQLSCHCAMSLPTFAPTHLSPLYALGRSDRACCGGTILIPLSSPQRITPQSSNHAAFIRNAAGSALCM